MSAPQRGVLDPVGGFSADTVGQSRSLSKTILPLPPGQAARAGPANRQETKPAVAATTLPRTVLRTLCPSPLAKARETNKPPPLGVSVPAGGRARAPLGSSTASATRRATASGVSPTSSRSS